MHDLLNHLTAVGFSGSPRVLGTDDADREILEFVPGEVGRLSETQPLPAWFRTPEGCWSIGRWIRDFQSAQAGLWSIQPSRGDVLKAVFFGRTK